MHVHLDPVGGVAGDMFVAALLDSFPEHREAVLNSIRAADLQGEIDAELVPFNDGVLTGSQFHVSSKAARAHAHHSDHHQHGHHHWSALRRQLEQSALSDSVKNHTIGIFGELALAEAKVHGKEVQDVAFHEVGNWDSIADIVGAATLICALSPKSWSIGSLPIGRGLVTTAHGELPVPAPATTLLLKGFALHDDGRAGERVTPTGAAILRYLSPTSGIGQKPRTLIASGFGFGSRKLAGMSNTLRLLAFDETHSGVMQDRVGVIEFEIDDQTGEELAVALTHIRDHAGVIDATQSMVSGKKGRLMTAVRVLTKPDAINDVATACFRQTTTIGLRTRIEERHILSRHEHRSQGGIAVKVVDRPGGHTAKAEMDAVQENASSQKARDAARQAAEREALGNSR
ncbi:MAG: LarC family nickel insertion protein [Pseudomonadota bacterium]